MRTGSDQGDPAPRAAGKGEIGRLAGPRDHRRSSSIHGNGALLQRLHRVLDLFFVISG